MNHLEKAKNGKRVVIAGYPQMLPGQQILRVLKTLERSLIHHFLSEAHDLVNKQGTRIRRHEIESHGGIPKAFVPTLMYLEKKGSE
jgi:predicted AlkP superfamily phosphohydrolase/phosphomutase